MSSSFRRSVWNLYGATAGPSRACRNVPHSIVLRLGGASVAKPAECFLAHSVMNARPSFSPNRDGEGPMRTYVTAASMAFGLVAVWAALVPFVA